MTDKVLALDDNPMIVKTISLVLASRYKVIGARCYDQAVIAHRENEDAPVLITDINLHEYLTGIDFVKYVKLLTPFMQIIYLSGEADHELFRNNIKVAGSRQFLEKPIDPETLTKAVQVAMVYRRLLDKLVDLTFIHEELDEHLNKTEELGRKLAEAYYEKNGFNEVSRELAQRFIELDIKAAIKEVVGK